MPRPEHYVRVTVGCSAGSLHDLHEVCVEIRRQVPPELRCQPDAAPGYASGVGGTCQIPSIEELSARVEREVRDNLEASKRRGYVLVER